MMDPGIALYDADDARLLNLVGAGHAEAFGVLSERHASAARKLARQLVSPEDVEEVVADAFGRVRGAIGRGGGPSNAVRPYVLTALRRVCDERQRGQLTRLSPEEQPLTDPGEQLVDPAVAGVEQTLAARAYHSLPDRWRAVLWHTEIEQEHPLVITPLLGLARNGIVALDRQAIDGLREAYLQLYIAAIAQPECEPVAERLGAYVGDALPAPDATQIWEHLRGCNECRAAYSELADIKATLRGTVAKLILGADADAYLPAIEAPDASDVASASQTGVMSQADGDFLGRAPAPLQARRSRHARRRVPRSILVAAGVAIVVLVSGAVALALDGNNGETGTGGAIASPPRSPIVGLPAQVGPSPSTSASPSTTPTPAPKSPQAGPTSGGQTLAALSASIDISQSQFARRANTDEIGFDVENTGSATTGPLTVAISLPPGTSLGGQPSSPSPGFTGGVPQGTGAQVDGFGWSCEPTESGITCMHAPVPAGQHVDGRLSVTVSGFMTCGKPVRLTASSGSVTAQAEQDLRC